MSKERNSIFQFKQFLVDQTGCAMKVNTDGVLLGALAAIAKPSRILDIGAGTGVIALMLAQRFLEAKIDAVEIDPQAASTAHRNFHNSPFASRLTLHAGSFVEFFENARQLSCSLIVTNPPFFLNSLKSESKAKQTARHTDASFFKDLFSFSAQHLETTGMLMLILPVDTVAAIQPMADAAGFYISQVISIRSYAGSDPHRQIVGYALHKTELQRREFVIYASEKVYSRDYQLLLKDFLTIF